MRRDEQLAAFEPFAELIRRGYSAAAAFRQVGSQAPGTFSEVTVRRAAMIIKKEHRKQWEGEEPSSAPAPDPFAAARAEFERLTQTKTPEDLLDFFSDHGRHIVASDRKMSKAESEHRKYKTLYKSALEDIEEANERAEILAALESSPVPRRRLMPREDERPGTGVAHVVASDWHIEEMVDPAVVDGMNEYNPDIAEARADRFFSNALKRINKHRRDLDIDHLILWLLGDFITGYIHEELEESNPLSPTEATLMVQGMLRRGIDMLLDRGDFEKITVPCCRGNHGRTTRKKRIATEYKNSYEWLLYKFIAKTYDKEERIEFIIPHSSTVYLDVFDKTIRAHHGDAFRSAGGIGGIAPPLFKWLMRANEQRHADMTFIGHWHQLIMPRGDISVNGSLIGMNSYAKEIGCKPEPPMQTLRIQSRERGFTTLEPIFCGEGD